MFKLRLPSVFGHERDLLRMRLEFVRFRKLLENARAVLTLIDDGTEKLGGEYIFDRQYVVGLVDGVLERQGMVVFDAAVLAPEVGERLYGLHDRLRRYAREELLGGGTAAPGSAGAGTGGHPWAGEPEFRLLSRALDWMSGPQANGQPAVLDLLRETFVQVAGRLPSGDGGADLSRSVDVTFGGIRNRFGIFDLEAAARDETGTGSGPREIDCPALGLMLVGASEAGRGAGSAPGSECRRWRAIIDGEYLSLLGHEGPGRLVLDACLSGHVDSDFVFVFTERTGDLRRLLPHMFRLEETANGAFAWIYDVPGIKVEESLRHLGRELFSPGRKTSE